MSKNVIRVKTAIIGAGASAISAAINLLNHGYEDFLMFEALERIGGRVDTIINDNGYLEVGAQWIHGQDGNPLYEIAKKHNLLLEGFDKLGNKSETYESAVIQKTSDQLIEKINIKEETDRTIFATQHGSKISSKFGQSVYDTITRLISDAEKYEFDKSKVNTASKDARVGDFINEKFIETVKKDIRVDLENEWSESDAHSIERLLYGILLMRLKRENIRSGTSNVYDISLANFSVYQEFPGISYVELKSGFKPILEAYIGDNKEKLNSKIRLRHHLKRILIDSSLQCVEPIFDNKSDAIRAKYTNDKNKVVLVICDESETDKPKDVIVVADHVICTMGLGYLKENFNNILTPLSLFSEERRLAVNRLGFGTINKIFLFYEKPFWSEKLELINMIWLPENSEFRLDKLIVRNSTKRLWYEDICKVEVVRSHPNTLSAWIAGTEEFEKLDDKTIADECTRLLRRFLADETIPEPKSIFRSKWNSNRYSRGSYSHLPIGAKQSDFELLSQPIPSKEKPIIMFAGEHTHKDYFSTVHGAFLSGIRESERLLSNQ